MAQIYEIYLKILQKNKKIYKKNKKIFAGLRVNIYFCVFPFTNLCPYYFLLTILHIIAMDNYLELFQNLGFPIAVCVVLFTIIIFFFKKVMAVLEQIMHNIDSERKAHIDYLQQTNKELAAIISKNSDALNRFSGLMALLSKKIDKIDSAVIK